MLKLKESSQNEYKFVFIDELVPGYHFLRLIDKYVDFSFLLEKMKCENCSLLSQCTRSKNKVKVVTRYVWEDHKEKSEQALLTEAC